MRPFFIFFIFLILQGMNCVEAGGFSFYRQRDQGHLQPSYVSDLPKKNVYFKIGHGFSYGRLLDQRMSNLHYTGPGMVLTFSRYAEHERYRSELNFVGIGFQVLQPGHEGTTVNNPFVGIRYSHLRKLNVRNFVEYHVGGQIETFANVRIAPALSNSFLYVDFIGSLQPRLEIGYMLYLFDREFYFDFSLAFGILGYGIRIPEYGTSYQIGSSGGEVLSNYVQMWLHPGNYRNMVTGIYYNNQLGRINNPNRYRVGYIWDYSRISGSHGLSFYNTSHQLVLEFLFLVN